MRQRGFRPTAFNTWPGVMHVHVDRCIGDLTEKCFCFLQATWKIAWMSYQGQHPPPPAPGPVQPRHFQCYSVSLLQVSIESLCVYNNVDLFLNSVGKGAALEVQSS